MQMASVKLDGGLSEERKDEAGSQFNCKHSNKTKGTQHFYFLPSDHHRDKMSFMRNSVAAQLHYLMIIKCLKNRNIIFVHSCVYRAAGLQLILKQCNPKLQDPNELPCISQCAFN